MKSGKSFPLAAVVLWGTLLLAAAYDIKDLQIKPAEQYAAHQDFQNVTIGAYPCDTLLKTREIFDTDKLFEKDFLPILLVIENRNPFPLQLFAEDIYLVDAQGRQHAAVDYVDVLLEINLEKRISEYSKPKDILLENAVDKEMYLDFQHKSFGEKIIAPQGSDYGVLFYRRPYQGSLPEFQLYLPEVTNFSTGESLVFFEFPLQ